MASTSTSTSMGPFNQNHAKFKVFLSFKGEDTRHSFTDHLYVTLKRAAIHTFRDDDEIKSGRDLGPEIVEAIEGSRASVVAKSRWCLEELWLILEQKRKGNHFVLPVFYKVDPSDVRHQRQSFAIEGSKWTEVDVNRWKSALTEVANLKGMVASGSETKFIATIVHTVSHELGMRFNCTLANLTGVETRAKDINSWLKDEHSITNVLAICGMGCSGKTTLAQHIYNLHKHNFECSSFLEEIGSHCKENCGLLGLQKQFLPDILGGENTMISCVSEGTTKIKEALHMKKMLIVLEDIDDHERLKLFTRNKCHPNTKQDYYYN